MSFDVRIKYFTTVNYCRNNKAKESQVKEVYYKCDIMDKVTETMSESANSESKETQFRLKMTDKVTLINSNVTKSPQLINRKVNHLHKLER